MEADYSSETAQVMSIAGSLEPHDPPRPGAQYDPDWNKLYQYLSGLLEGNSMGHKSLTTTEAAVILDLLQNLSDNLNSLETSTQRDLMLKKYDLLASNFMNFRATRENEALTHGLEKDPLEEEIPPYVPKSTIKQDGSTSSSRVEEGAGTSSGTTQNRTVRKSTLFSINPFSVPVKYLRPTVKDSSHTCEPKQ